MAATTLIGTIVGGRMTGIGPRPAAESEWHAGGPTPHGQAIYTPHAPVKPKPAKRTLKP